MKIINVLKDDSLAEILEVFRQAPAGEVIFVLPKNGKVFKKEDHFAAFASEAANAGKTISILAPNPQVVAMARAYKFNVMSSRKASKEKAKPAAALASAPPPSDTDKPDPNEDAYEEDVVVPSDETMNVTSPEEAGTPEETLEGFQIKDEAGEPVDLDGDGMPDRPTGGEVAAPEAELTAVPADTGAMDYIDAVWRQRAAAQGTAQVRPEVFQASVKRVSRKVVGGILAASMGVLAVVVWATTGSAKVVVTPVSRDLDLQVTVQASDVYAAIDSNFNKIPGQLFEATASATIERPATGSREVASKARGKITVSNAYSSSPQTLRATTRFGASNGTVFRTLQTVTVPGSTVKDGVPAPGSVTIDVIADKPGAQYNLPPGDWTILAFREQGDMERAEKISGTSTEAMTGGANGPSSVITQEDYDSALQAARERVTTQLREAFDAQAAGMTLLEDAKPTWADLRATHRPDDAANAVSVTATGTLKTVAFRPADLEKLIAEVVLKKERLVVLPDQLQLSFGDVSFKPELGTLGFSVTVKGPGYVPLDRSVVRTDIKGKGTAAIRDYFSNQEGVESATVSLSPFWVRSVPSKDSRITIDIRYLPDRQAGLPTGQAGLSPTPTP